MAKLCPLMSELRWAYPLLSMISLLSFLDIFLMCERGGKSIGVADANKAHIRKKKVS